VPTVVLEPQDVIHLSRLYRRNRQPELAELLLRYVSSAADQWVMGKEAFQVQVMLEEAHLALCPDHLKGVRPALALSLARDALRVMLDGVTFTDGSNSQDHEGMKDAIEIIKQANGIVHSYYNAMRTVPSQPPQHLHMLLLLLPSSSTESCYTNTTIMSARHFQVSVLPHEVDSSEPIATTATLLSALQQLPTHDIVACVVDGGKRASLVTAALEDILRWYRQAGVTILFGSERHDTVHSKTALGANLTARAFMGRVGPLITLLEAVQQRLLQPYEPKSTAIPGSDTISILDQAVQALYVSWELLGEGPRDVSLGIDTSLSVFGIGGPSTVAGGQWRAQTFATYHENAWSNLRGE